MISVGLIFTTVVQLVKEMVEKDYTPLYDAYLGDAIGEDRAI